MPLAVRTRLGPPRRRRGQRGIHGGDPGRPAGGGRGAADRVRRRHPLDVVAREAAARGRPPVLRRRHHQHHRSPRARRAARGAVEAGAPAGGDARGDAPRPRRLHRAGGSRAAYAAHRHPGVRRAPARRRDPRSERAPPPARDRRTPGRVDERPDRRPLRPRQARLPARADRVRACPARRARPRTSVAVHEPAAWEAGNITSTSICEAVRSCWATAAAAPDGRQRDRQRRASTARPAGRSRSA